MNPPERIKKDMELFSKNIKEIESIEFHGREDKVIEMAKSYYTDTEYYIKKEDYFTAFGCVSYAHGLLDSVRILTKKI